MPRLIDADALIAKAYIMQEPNGFIHSVVTERQIVAAPTIDAVPVVRCKECVYYEEAKVNELGFIICRASGMEITENDFCSYGERRSDD